MILGYARRFGVPLETFVNVNRSAGWDFGGRVKPERRMVNDMRGRLGELLAKAIDQHALDAAVPKDELDASASSSRPTARLDADGRYPPDGPLGLCGRGRRLCPGAGPLPPLALQASSLPVAGASRFPICSRHLGHAGADASAGRRHGSHRPCALRAGEAGGAAECAGHRDPPGRATRVRIEHGPGRRDRSGLLRLHAADADPGADPERFLAREEGRARRPCDYLPSVKVAFESAALLGSDDSIYGGLAWTDRLNENVIYPSGGYQRSQGRAGRRLWRRLDEPGQPAAVRASQP